ncbi:RNA polymerase I-specific transcription initiation factor rrn5 [Leucoagaricus sp. SymC.cos]|nr:RNA polymerase I-specific transcription initiation factor rrn5 [Leucoagaricus sp. SymC.cos]
MRKQEEILLHGTSELHPYLALYNQHLCQLREHLGGVSHKNVDESSYINGVLWEASEKDAFFHALRVHSRLRPDLIAGCIMSKNQAEVLDYLEYLEEGLKGGDFLAASYRKDMPLAHEVSDAWVVWEEEYAERLQANEEIWTLESDQDAVRTTGEVQEDCNGRTVPFGRIPLLTYGHLVVLDSILKSEEKAASLPAQSLSKVGSMSPMRTLQPSASPTLNASFERSPPVPSQQDFSPSGGNQSYQVLSPRSRRRYQKRMYMRRKRAQTTAKTTDKPQSGRRKKKVQNSSTSTITKAVAYDQKMGTKITADTVISGLRDPADDSDQISKSEESEDEETDPLFATSRLRIPHKTIRSSFQQRNVSSEAIEAFGLDIFNYKKLGKLLRHFISGYDPSLISEDASLNSETLVLFLDILKDFLTQIISRVIILEEEHQRFRGKSKVWRKNSDEGQKGIIDKSAIQFALKTMGVTNEALEQYFAKLLDEDYEPFTHQRTGYDDNDRLISHFNILHQHPLHQDVYPPHYHVSEPKDQWSSADYSSDTQDNLMDIETDERELAVVLEEEQALDEDDALVDATHEDSLWTTVPLRKRKSCFP